MPLSLARKLSICASLFVLAGITWDCKRISADSALDDLLPGSGDSHPYDAANPPYPIHLSRDDAAKWFVGFLNYCGQARNRTSDPNYFFERRDNRTQSNFVASISHLSKKQLGTRLEPFLFDLASEWNRAPQAVHTIEQSGKSATVSVQPAAATAHPLVLIQEPGGWGVDLIETYAKWHNLQGAAKALAVFRMTGVQLTGLPQSPEINRLKVTDQRSLCQANLLQVLRGVQQYLQDYDEQYPRTGPWMDELQPYIKNEPIFTCPALPAGTLNGYAYNMAVNAAKGAELATSTKTVLIYETNILKRNVNGNGSDLAYRHQGGALFGYADGHVQWWPSSQVPSLAFTPK